MDPIFTQTTTSPLLEEYHTHLEYCLPNIGNCDEEGFIPMTNLFNEHRFQEEHAHDKTSFVEMMSDVVYKCDYEVLIIW